MTDEQLTALWDTAIEMGDDGQRGYVRRDVSYLFYISPK